MTKIKIKIPDHIEQHYKIGGTNFCWCSSIQKDGKVVQLSKFTSCKDYLSDVMHTDIVGNTSELSGAEHAYSTKFSPRMDQKVTRLLIRIDKEREADSVFTGKRILNTLEEEIGWKKTVIKEVVHRDEPKCFMIISSGAYLRKACYVSLLSTIMRSSSFKEPQSPKTWEESENLLKEWGRGAGGDARLIKSVADWALPIMSNRKEIFKGLKKDVIWPKTIQWYGFHNKAGFKSMCDERSHSVEINKRIRKFKNKYPKEYK